MLHLLNNSKESFCTNSHPQSIQTCVNFSKKSEVSCCNISSLTVRLLWLIKVPLECSHVTFSIGVSSQSRHKFFRFPWAWWVYRVESHDVQRAIAPTRWRPGGNQFLVFLGFEQLEISKGKITTKRPCPLSKKVFNWSLKIIGDSSFALRKRVSKTIAREHILEVPQITT